MGAVDSSGIEDLKSLESDIDILFLPIGGDGVLSPEEAYKLAVSLEPRVIVPIHYDKDSLKTFLKESGEENIKPVDKLTLRKKDIAGKEGEIVVLSQS